MATLTRIGGGARNFTSTELNGLLAALRGAGQARFYDSQICFLNAGTGLLLLDVNASYNFRIGEQFEAQANQMQPLGVQFTSDGAVFSYSQALAAVRYSGPLPPASLSSVYAAFWDSGAGAYVQSPGTATSLVVSEGLFGSAAAVLPPTVSAPK